MHSPQQNDATAPRSSLLSGPASLPLIALLLRR